MDRASSFRSPTFVRGWSGFVSISSSGIQRPSDAPNRDASASTKWESCRIFASDGSPLRLDTGKHLLGERVVLGRAAGTGREGENGFAVGGALLEPDALGDRRLEDLVAEDGAD